MLRFPLKGCHEGWIAFHLLKQCFFAGEVSLNAIRGRRGCFLSPWRFAFHSCRSSVRVIRVCFSPPMNLTRITRWDEIHDFFSFIPFVIGGLEEHQAALRKTSVSFVRSCDSCLLSPPEELNTNYTMGRNSRFFLVRAIRDRRLGRTPSCPTKNVRVVRPFV